MKIRKFLCLCMTLLLALSACSAPPDRSDASVLSDTAADSEDSDSRSVSGSSSSVTDTDETNIPSEEPSFAIPSVSSLPLIKKLECITSDAVIRAVAEAPDGLIAVFQHNSKKENDFLYIEKKLLYIDPVQDKIVREMTAEEEDQLLGISRDGTVIMNDIYHNTIKLYDDKGSLLKQFPVDSSELLYRQEDNCIYTTAGTLKQIDLEGNVKTLLNLEVNGRLEDMQPDDSHTVIVRTGTVHDASPYPYDYLCCSLTDNTHTFIDNTNEFSDYYFCDNGFLACRQADEQTEYPESQLCVFSPSQSAPTVYRTGGHYQLSLMNRSGLVIGTFPPYETAGGNDCVALFNTQNGTKALLPEFSDDSTYTPYALPKSSLIALTAGTDPDSAHSLYLINPAKADFSVTLSAAAQEEKNKPDVFSCGSHLQEMRLKADELEKKYAVSILIGNEIKNVNNDTEFNNISIEEGEMYLTEEEQVQTTGLTLNAMEKLLKLYGKEYFETFRDFKGEGGLKIMIVQSVESKTGLRDAYAYSHHVGAWYYMVIPSLPEELLPLDFNFHHEMWHNTESCITGHIENAFGIGEWSALNAEGFSYRYEQKGYLEDQSGTPYMLTENKDKDQVCVISYYSCVNPQEDRATFIEYMTDNPQDPVLSASYPEAASYDSMKDYFLTYPHLKAKYEYMKHFTEQVFGNTYWPFR